VLDQCSSDHQPKFRVTWRKAFRKLRFQNMKARACRSGAGTGQLSIHLAPTQKRHGPGHEAALLFDGGSDGNVVSTCSYTSSVKKLEALIQERRQTVAELEVKRSVLLSRESVSHL
jgi:hypothetical protein